MEANTGDANHLDSNVLLPPRKRLLACMKKQNGDGNDNGNGNSYLPSSSSSMNVYSTRLNNLLSVNLGDDNLSQEEIVEASRSAAEVAVKIAIAARAAAEKKAIIATMAMAAAKKALELVMAIDEQETSSSTELQLKKNKTKKHVQVQMLYDKNKPRFENDKRSDEELARQLHQVINSSPRISKHGSAPELKDYEHKRLKIPAISENGRNNTGSVVIEENSPSSSHRNKFSDRVARVNLVENVTKVNILDVSRTGNGDAQTIDSKVQFSEEDTSRKRGRMKQKKLPLSICHDRDQLNPKNKTAMPIERSSLWKCESFKASARLKQNKSMQS